MALITIQEMKADLDATQRDIGRLEDIVEALDLFISDSYGENRSAFKTDLLKYRALLIQAERIKTAIANRIAESVSESFTA